MHLPICTRVLLTLLSIAAIDASAEVRPLKIEEVGRGESIAYDMNAAGQVAVVLKDANGLQHAAYWENGQLFRLDTLGGIESESKGINDHGEIIGSAQKANGSWAAFIYSRAKGMRELGTLGGFSTNGTGLNNRGEAVGFADTPDGQWHAFLSQPGKPMQDLGTLGGKISYASGINNHSQVVGTAMDRNGFRHAFFYDAKRGMVDLGTLGGRFSSAAAINDDGWVVGTSEMKDRSWHAFLFDGKEMKDLGALIGRGDSFATGINNAGHVVGTVKLDGERLGDRRLAFVWRDQKMNLHPSGKALYVTNAINNQGQVIGANYDRGFHAATMPSNMTPFVDRDGEKILSFNLLMPLLAGALVVFRKRLTGLVFSRHSSV